MRRKVEDWIALRGKVIDWIYRMYFKIENIFICFLIKSGYVNQIYHQNVVQKIVISI